MLAFSIKSKGVGGVFGYFQYLSTREIYFSNYSFYFGNEFFWWSTAVV